GLYERLEQNHITWGPRWRWMREIRAGGGRSLTRIEPSEATGLQSVVHPTRLDTGFATVFTAMLPKLAGAQSAPHLPYAIDALRWYAPAEGTTFWHAELRTQDVATADVIASDLRLLDEEGGVLLEIEGFTGKRAPRETFLQLGDAALRAPFWVPGFREVSLQPAAKRPDRFMVLASREAEVLCELLREGGAEAEALRWDDPELSERLAASSAGAVVCLWDDGDDGLEPPARAQRNVEQGLLVVQALARRERPLQLFWVTRGGQVLSGGPDPSQAALWGFGRCVMQEHPELGLRLIDVPPGALPPVIEALHAEADPAQILWAGGRWHALRVSETAAGGEVALGLDPDETVLITGGLGALGAHVARWLVERQGARRLVLMSRRSAQSEADRRLVDELRAAGAEVDVAAVDVADAEALRRFWARDRKLAGVIHAAGVIDDGVILQRNPEHVRRVFGPKAAGAWNLHELTKASPLRFFVLFSSTSAIAGAPGQSNYAAANAFLDALAQRRAAEGLCAQSVSWGAWEGAGMAAGLDETAWRRMERLGMQRIKPAEGVAWLGQAMALSAPHIAVWPLQRQALLAARS
ncbi:MAG: SDR family NAD(P)-dependent oxidoreductase, partial [Polyangiaceae bacterium]|nr:SDR family NAD(P)-dependent oxidoreductase [Polyangiaceae bacterium]